jgi:hypothetical protein
MPALQTLRHRRRNDAKVHNRPPGERELLAKSLLLDFFTVELRLIPDSDENVWAVKFPCSILLHTEQRNCEL